PCPSRDGRGPAACKIAHSLKRRRAAARTARPPRCSPMSVLLRTGRDRQPVPGRSPPDFALGDPARRNPPGGGISDPARCSTELGSVLVSKPSWRLPLSYVVRTYLRRRPSHIPDDSGC